MISVVLTNRTTNHRWRKLTTNTKIIHIQQQKHDKPLAPHLQKGQKNNGYSLNRRVFGQTNEAMVLVRLHCHDFGKGSTLSQVVPVMPWCFTGDLYQSIETKICTLAKEHAS